MTANPILEHFEGIPVITTAAKITKAGDGLSASLKTGGVVLHHGEEILVVLRTRVAAVALTPVDRDDVAMGFMRTHTLEATACTIAEGNLVDQLDELLRDQETRNRIRREEEQGIKHLFDADGDPVDDDELTGADGHLDEAGE